MLVVTWLVELLNWYVSSPYYLPHFLFIPISLLMFLTGLFGAFLCQGSRAESQGVCLFFFFFLPLYPLLFLNRNNKTNRFERVWWEHTYTEWQGEGQDRKAVIKTGEHKENREFFREVPNAILLLSFCSYSLASFLFLFISNIFRCIYFSY